VLHRDAGLLDLDDSTEARDEVLVLVLLPDLADVSRARGVDARTFKCERKDLPGGLWPEEYL
jgi:hypothetical protein